MLPLMGDGVVREAKKKKPRTELPFSTGFHIVVVVGLGYMQTPRTVQFDGISL